MGARTAEKVVHVVHVPHHKCNGTGSGTRYGRRCRACSGTGEAGIAFKKAYDERSMLDDILELYVDSCYGDAKHYFEDDKRPCYVLTVLQHSIEREALDTVMRLGGADRVFNWLVLEERKHCPLGSEADWEPATSHSGIVT